ncbi:MAG TPA: neutral zinc metallopeptidase [Asticcacaulis sp.]|nr:neutral zinc metallopeptidase [Asticcacaulis sp.]
MKWEEGRSGGVEDRRGLTAGHYAGGGGIAVVVVALIGYFVFGIDPRQILDSSQNQPAALSDSQTPGTSCPQGDETCHFADVIHTSANDTWAAIFKAEGKSYRPSTIVLYNGMTQTGCGGGDAQMGPFYCPEDERVYLDLDFFNTLEQQLGAKGDFARAYVIAHEVGHHIQKLQGISDAVTAREQRLSQSGANALSVKLELQADCYAGVWAKQSNLKMNWLEAGDIEEALGAASSVGDDTLEKATQGVVIPDSFTHGTSAQRMRWFKAGFDTGQPGACDTFNGAI